MKYLKVYEKFDAEVSRYDLIRDLDRNEILDFYYDNYHTTEDYYEPSWRELMHHFSNDNLWGYVDENRFIEDWINDKADELEENWENENFDENKLRNYISEWSDYDDSIRKIYISDFLNISEDDENYEKIKREIEEKSIIGILNELNEKNLKKIIQNLNYVNDFCKEYLENKYSNYSARRIMEEEGYDVGSDFFINDVRDVRDYMDYGYMCDDYNNDNPYEVEFSTIIEILADNLCGDTNIQRMVYENNPEENAVILVEKRWVSTILANQTQFQLDYVKGILLEKDIENPTWYVFNKLKKYFIDRGIEIAEDVVEKYEIDDFIEAYEQGFFGKK